MNFELTKRLEKRSDVAEIGKFRNCSSGRVKNELKTVSQVKKPENRQELVQQTKGYGLIKEKDFEFRVKLMR